MTVDPRQYDYFPCLRRLTVYTFTRDIQCSIVPEHYLLILKCSNNGLQNIPSEKLLKWLEKSTDGQKSKLHLIGC